MIDTNALAAALGKLAADLLSGRSPELVEVETKVKMPKQIYEVLNISAQNLGIDVSELVGKAASQGLSKYLQEANQQIPQAAKTTTPAVTDGIQEKMGQITELLDKLKNMQQVFDGLQGNKDKNS